MRGPVVGELASPQMRNPRRLVGAGSERSRITFGAGPIGTATQRFRKVGIAWQAQHFRNTDFVAGAALSQGQVFLRVELHGRHSIFTS